MATTHSRIQLRVPKNDIAELKSIAVRQGFASLSEYLRYAGFACGDLAFRIPSHEERARLR